MLRLLLLSILIIQLSLGSWLPQSVSFAAGNSDAVQMLEITDSGGSQQAPAYLALSRSIENINPEHIRKNDPFSIKYTIEPREIPLNELQVTGLRPLWMPKENYVIGEVYSFDHKTRGNFGPIAWTDKNDRSGFLKMMETGYNQPVQLNAPIDTMTGNSLKDEVKKGLADLYQKKATITLPIIDDSVLRGNSRKPAVLNFGRFEVTMESSGEYMGKFLGYVYNLDGSELLLKNLKFSETFPDHIEIVGKPASWSSENSKQLSGNLGDIRFTLNRDGTAYQAEAKTFAVTIQATQSGRYTLNHDQLDYLNYTNTAHTGSFNHITFNVHSAVEGVTLHKDQLVLYYDDPSRNSERLFAAVTPPDAENKDVTWTSSNEKVATVDSVGRVVAIKEGTATITATTVDGGFTDTSEVIVKSAKPRLAMPAMERGWNAFYPEKVKIVAEVIHADKDGALKPDFRINNQQIDASTMDKTGPVLTGDGLYKTTYTFEILQSQTTSGGPFIGPAHITGKVTDTKSNLSSDLVGNQIFFNPVVKFNATGTREGTSQNVALQAIPTGPVMDNVRYGWAYGQKTSVNHATKLESFTDGSKTYHVPLKQGEPYIAVAMQQDFNRDGDYLDENELSVDDVNFAGGYPDFTAAYDKEDTLGSIGIVTVAAGENVTAETKWSYTTSKNPIPVPVPDLMLDTINYLPVPFDKGTDGDPIRTNVYITADNGAGFATIKTVEMIPTATGDEGENGEDTPVVYVNSSVESGENRAVMVKIGYTFEGILQGSNVYVEVTDARYTIAEEGKAGGQTYSLDLNGRFANSYEKVLNLKTNNSKSKTFTITIELEYNVITITKKGKRVVTADPLVERRNVKVVATSTRQ